MSVFEQMILASCITRNANINSLKGLYHTASTVSGFKVVANWFSSAETLQYLLLMTGKPVSSKHSAGPMAPRTHHHFLSGALEGAALPAKINAVSTVTIAPLSSRPLCSHSVG